MIANWQGESRRRPQVTRFRMPDDMYGLRVKCWHGALAELVYPHRETVLSWEYPASLNPCRWVPACPEYETALRAWDLPPPVGDVSPAGRPTPQPAGSTAPTLFDYPEPEPDRAPRYGPRPRPRAAEDGWHVEVGCSDLCGATVVVMPENVDGQARCVDCGRRYHGATVARRPPPGWTKTNGLRLGQGGEHCYPVATTRARFVG